MSTGLWLDFLGIRMDSRKTEGMRYTIKSVAVAPIPRTRAIWPLCVCGPRLQRPS